MNLPGSKTEQQHNKVACCQLYSLTCLWVVIDQRGTSVMNDLWQQADVFTRKGVKTDYLTSTKQQAKLETTK